MFRTFFRSPIPGLLLLFCFAQCAAGQPAPSQTPPPAGSSVSSPPQTPSATQAAETPASAAATISPVLNPLGEAIDLYRKRDFDGALKKYQVVLQQNPKSPDAYAGLIRTYLKQEDVDQAAETADKGLAVSDVPRIRVAHGEVLFRQGRIDLAEKEWVDVVNSRYPEARAYLGLALVYRAAAMYKSAARMIGKAHEFDPADPDIQRRWISTLSRAERIKYFEDALASERVGDAEHTRIAQRLQALKERTTSKERQCHLANKVTATEAPLVRLMRDRKHLRGYGLSVELNGHKSSLLLDTGASGILVKRSAAERAGISKAMATKIWGIGDKGLRSAYIGTADSIKIGELEFQNCPVEVMESNSVADEDGLIGADVFQHFLVDIDFPDEKLKLSELPQRPGEGAQNLSLTSEDVDSDDPEAAESSDASKGTAANAAPHLSGPQDRYIAPGMQSYTRVYRFGHELLVPTKIGNVPYKLFLLDTGAFSNTISPEAAREVTKVHGNSDMIVKGISGSVDKVYSASKAVLQFGHLQQENQDIVGFDTSSLSEGAGTEISGFLGFAMLQMLDIKIDYRDALVDFSYDPKRRHF